MKVSKRYEEHFFHDDNGRAADCVQSLDPQRLFLGQFLLQKKIFRNHEYSNELDTGRLGVLMRFGHASR